MKLAAKFILLVIIGIVIETTVFGYFASKLFIASIQREHTEVARMLRQAESEVLFQQAVLSEDSGYLNEMLQQMHDAPDHVIKFRVVELDETTDDGHRPSVADAGKILQSGDFASEIGPSKNGTRSLFTFISIKFTAKNDAIECETPLEEADYHQLHTWMMALLKIGAMGLFSIAIVMIAGIRWIGRPLDALTAKMQQVGKGELTGPLEIRTRDELGQLASSVNNMCQQLEDQKATIERETSQRVQALELLRHADRLKIVGQLAAGFAHEVGTPLNVVAGRASMILADPKMPPEKIRENAQAIKTESNRISSIVQKLLDFARQGESNKTVGDLREVVNHSVQLIRPLIGKRKIAINTSLPDDPANAKFDFNQMQQVLINLIDNAVDASADGAMIEVVLNRSPDQLAWQLEIVDQGHGIDPAKQDTIFEPFFTTKDVGSGTGLGLSIVHGIVEDHDGSIQLTSQPGQGTTFVVRLPAA